MADPALLQLQMRRNAEDLQDYLRDLGNWEDDIKKKDAMLHKQKPILKKADDSYARNLPPVRSEQSVSKQKRREKRKKTEDSGNKPAPRIKSFDYRAWDNFNVDAACEEVDYDVQNSSSEEVSEEEDEAEEEERRKQLAVLEKEKGNTLFKEGKYEAAVERYSRAVDLDPASAILPANRAMALLKLRRYAAAEQDCTLALELDATYMKAWLRRATARTLLGKLKAAEEDYRAVLKLEPSNKLAKSELGKLQQKLKAKEQDEQKVYPLQTVPLQAGPYVQAVQRPPHLRSKKPLRRIAIEEVGGKGAVGIAGAPVESRTGHLDIDSAVPASTVPVIVSTGKAHEESSETEVGAGEDSNTHSGEGGGGGAGEDAEGMEGGAGGEDVVVPSVATNSIQFQTHWKSLRKSKRLLSQYFQTIPPSKYPTLLQQSLETDIFSDILAILLEDYMHAGRTCMEELRWLTKVKRFQVAVMFLSKFGKQTLGSLFSGLKALVSSPEEQQELTALAKQFSTN